MAQTAAERTEKSRIGIQARLAREDPHQMTQAAREGQWRKFYGQTDPELPEAERVRRAQALRKEHMARMRQAKLTAARKRKAAERAARDAQQAEARLADLTAGDGQPQE